MNEAKRNGYGLPAGYAEAAMTPATYGPAQYQPCGPAYGAYTCAGAYETEKHMMMCDVCDMLHDIKSVVSDTNGMVKNIYHKCFRETQRTSTEAEKK